MKKLNIIKYRKKGTHYAELHRYHDDALGMELIAYQDIDDKKIYFRDSGDFSGFESTDLSCSIDSLPFTSDSKVKINGDWITVKHNNNYEIIH